MEITRTTGRLIEATLISLLVITPLVKGTVHPWSIAIAHFLVMVCASMWLLETTITWRFNLSSTGLEFPLFLILVLAAISWAASISSYDSLQAFLVLLNLTVVYFLLVNKIRTRQQVRRVAYVVVAMGSALALFGMVKFLGDVTPPWWDFETKYKGLTGWFVCKNHSAGYLEMSLCLAIGLFMATREGLKKLFLAGAIVFTGVGLILTLSRGGWIAGTVALALILFIYTAQQKQDKGKKYRNTRLALVALACFLLVSFTVLGSTPVIERLETLFQGQDVPTWQARQAVWGGTLEMIKDHPWLGTGPGTFGVGFTPYRPDGLKLRWQYAHNDYLHFISELGLLVVPLMVFMIYQVFKRAIDKIHTSKSRLERGVTLGALAGILAMIIHGVGDFNLHLYANGLLFTVLAALVMVSVVHETDEELDLGTRFLYFEKNRMRKAFGEGS